MQLIPNRIPLQKLHSSLFNSCAIDVLRLDLIHPIVSGNKWFKLKYPIQNAVEQNKETVATFGGAYSNHIVATAYACKEAGLKSIGIIRGEKSTRLSSTLQSAQDYGMELYFVSRESFRSKEMIKTQFDKSTYWVSEGGYSIEGMLGSSEILQVAGTSSYSHIICSCGTGTMMAGLINSALPYQKIIGISALKGHTGLEEGIKQLLPENKQEQPFSIYHDYHFGGYAKHPPILIEWIKLLWQEEHLPTDIVYTSKLLFAVKDLAEKHFFDKNDRLLIIHSGGLQGNLSLPINTLPF